MKNIVQAVIDFRD